MAVLNRSFASLAEATFVSLSIISFALAMLAMIRVYSALKENYPQARLLLQVHDELIVECPEEEAESVAQLISKEMEQVAALRVPLVAEAKWGKSWYEAK